MDKLGNGLEIAFGFGNDASDVLDKSDDEITDESQYGRLGIATLFVNGTYYEHKPIPFRPCTNEELGLGPDGFDDPLSKFYKFDD